MAAMSMSTNIALPPVPKDEAKKQMNTVADSKPVNSGIAEQVQKRRRRKENDLSEAKAWGKKNPDPKPMGRAARHSCLDVVVGKAKGFKS